MYLRASCTMCSLKWKCINADGWVRICAVLHATPPPLLFLSLVLTSLSDTGTISWCLKLLERCRRGAGQLPLLARGSDWLSCSLCLLEGSQNKELSQMSSERKRIWACCLWLAASPQAQYWWQHSPKSTQDCHVPRLRVPSSEHCNFNLCTQSTFVLPGFASWFQPPIDLHDEIIQAQPGKCFLWKPLVFSVLPWDSLEKRKHVVVQPGRAACSSPPSHWLIFHTVDTKPFQNVWPRARPAFELGFRWWCSMPSHPGCLLPPQCWDASTALFCTATLVSAGRWQRCPWGPGYQEEWGAWSFSSHHEGCSSGWVSERAGAQEWVCDTASLSPPVV